jgi:NAD(P)H-flavin reductase
MRPLTVTVARNERIVGRLSRLTLAAEALGAAQPGQWIALTRPEARAILGRPFPLGALDPRTGQADIFYRQDAHQPGGAPHRQDAHGPGTLHREDTSGPAPAIARPEHGPYRNEVAGSPSSAAPADSAVDRDDPTAWSWLATLPAGASLDLLGPWGRPFQISALARHVVMLGGGTRLFGLLALAWALTARGDAVVVLHDAPTASDLVPPALLPPAAEYHVATLDGSAGAAGVALDLLPPLLRWADAVYAALPPDDYLPLRDLVHRHRLRVRRGYATVLAEASLACYAGACDGCGIRLRTGSYALLCKDGPAFDLLDL